MTNQEMPEGTEEEILLKPARKPCSWAGSAFGSGKWGKSVFPSAPEYMGGTEKKRRLFSFGGKTVL